MEVLLLDLSPSIYHHIVRPHWFAEQSFLKTIGTYNFSNKKILDFGCGIGAYSMMFSAKNYIGVDIDAKRIRYARLLNPEYKFIQIKGETLPIADHSIDYIIIISVLHHIPSDIVYKYLEEFKRILNPSGRLLVVEPCKMKKKKLSNRIMPILDRGKYIRNEEEYYNLFKNTGYKVKVYKTYKQLVLYNKIFLTAIPL